MPTTYFDPEIDLHLVYEHSRPPTTEEWEEEGRGGNCTNCCQSNIRFRFVARETKSSPLPEVATG